MKLAATIARSLQTDMPAELRGIQRAVATPAAGSRPSSAGKSPAPGSASGPPTAGATSATRTGSSTCRTTGSRSACPRCRRSSSTPVKLNPIALEFTSSGPAAATISAIAQGETRFGTTQGGTPTTLIRDDGLIEGADPTIAALTDRIDVRFADTTLGRRT
jgi:hypothetical protein